MPSASGIRAGRAFVEIGATTHKLQRGLRRASAKLKAFGAGVSAVGLKLARVGALMALPFAAGAKVFASFEEQMAQVSTMLDQPAKHMKRFTVGIRKMSVQFGESTETLAQGLYDILSASIAPAKALEVLAVAARAARGGLTDTGTAADAITTILNSYGLSADRAADVSDLLFAIVKRGKTTFAELAPAIGMVASTAAAGGVSLEELGATLATLTRNGVKTQNAVTAVNQIVSAFLKPTDEAAAAAKALGFEMSSTTLKTKGLVWVFNRISKLPPDAIAKLFPNIRALRGVIPAVKNMQGFIKDMGVMAGRAGMAEAAYKKLANTLAQTFRKIKQGAIAAFSVIGEALAPALQTVGKWIRVLGERIGVWLKQNKALVVMIAATAAGILAAGLALMVLGKAIAIVGGILSGLATIAGVVATAFKLLGLTISFLLSPIGLVIAAFAALAGYLIHASGASGKAMDWLGKKFSSLADFAKKSFHGIALAMKAGDLALAAKILWASLKIAWLTGVKFLKDKWLDFKFWFMRVGTEAFYGVLKGWEYAWHGLRIAWIEASSFFKKLWILMVRQLQMTWTAFTAFAKKALGPLVPMLKKILGWANDLNKAVGEALLKVGKVVAGVVIKTEIEKGKIAAGVGKAALDAYQKALLDPETVKLLKEEEGSRKGRRSENTKRHDARLAELEQRRKAARKKLDQAQASEKKAAQGELDAVTQEWQDLLKVAKDKYGLKPDDGPDNLPDPPEPPDMTRILKRLGDAATGLVKRAKVEVRGTFNPNAMLGLLASATTAERTANATEGILKNTKKIHNEQKKGGVFT